MLHKNSIKIVKTKQYKAYRGPHNEVPDFVCPEALHVDHFHKVLKKAKELQQKLEKENFSKEQVQMPTSKVEEKIATEDEKVQKQIIIPGMDSQKENLKKPVVIESDKYMPNHKVNEFEEDGSKFIQFVFEVPEESSSKDIEIDVSSDSLKLNSAK